MVLWCCCYGVVVMVLWCRLLLKTSGRKSRFPKILKNKKKFVLDLPLDAKQSNFIVHTKSSNYF